MSFGSAAVPATKIPGAVVRVGAVNMGVVTKPSLARATFVVAEESHPAVSKFSDISLVTDLPGIAPWHGIQEPVIEFWEGMLSAVKLPR